MNTLSIYLLNLINNYNNNITIIHLYQTSKYYKDLLENNKNKIIKIKDNIVDLYSSVIISLMGGIKNILNYPELEWDDKYLGSTGYIDRIRVKNVTHKIMRGIDKWNRPFITLRLKDNDEDTCSKYNSYIIVLFKRYYDDKKTWTHSINRGIDIFTDTGHFLRNDDIKDEHIINNMHNLLNNKNFIYKNDYEDPNKQIKIDISLI